MATWFLSILVALACTAGAQTRPAQTAQTTPKAPPAKTAQTTPKAPPEKAPPKSAKPRPATVLPTISTPCAVSYSPNLQRIDELKKQTQEPDTSDFYTVADDMMFYMSETETYLRKRNIKVVYTQAPKLRFLLADGSVRIVDLRKQTFAWGVLLFDGRHAPKDADITSPEADVKAIFHR